MGNNMPLLSIILKGADSCSQEIEAEDLKLGPESASLFG
jgi:hypothetical protein